MPSSFLALAALACHKLRQLDVGIHRITKIRNKSYINPSCIINFLHLISLDALPYQKYIFI